MSASAQSQDEALPLFGRRDEVKSLTNAPCARRSCLILSPKGIGKTRLLQESLSLARQPYVYFERLDVLHRFLVELAERLSCPAGRFKSVHNATSIALKPSVLDALRKLPRCLILENVVGADPKMYRFLQQVYYIPAVSLIVTAASRDCLGYLHKLLWNPREEITLKPLARSEARGLFDVASRMYQLQSFDLEAFRTKVLSAARGNPGHILAMCRMASRPEYQDGQHIKFLPLRIDMLTAFA